MPPHGLPGFGGGFGPRGPQRPTHMPTAWGEPSPDHLQPPQTDL